MAAFPAAGSAKCTASCSPQPSGKVFLPSRGGGCLYAALHICSLVTANAVEAVRAVGNELATCEAGTRPDLSQQNGTVQESDSSCAPAKPVALPQI